jgi:hypothetical protein
MIKQKQLLSKAPSFKVSFTRDSYCRKEGGPSPSDYDSRRFSNESKTISNAPRTKANEYIFGDFINENPSGAEYSINFENKQGKSLSKTVEKKAPITDLGPGRYGELTSLVKNSYNVNFNPSLKASVKKIY